MSLRTRPVFVLKNRRARRFILVDFDMISSGNPPVSPVACDGITPAASGGAKEQLPILLVKAHPGRARRPIHDPAAGFIPTSTARSRLRLRK